MHTDGTFHVKGKQGNKLEGMEWEPNRKKFRFDHGQTDGQTETQVQGLSCAFAAKKFNFFCLFFY